MYAMSERVESVSFSWVEEVKGQPCVPAKTKRKYISKKKEKEFVGWGSKALVEFLQAIGKDASKQLSQYEVTDIINKYVNDNTLIHPGKKKRIVCDEKLHALFGRKTIGRIKIYDLLGSHFASNQEESDDDLFYSSEEKEDNSLATCDEHKFMGSEKKAHKKKVLKPCKSSIAAIIPENIKLVYLKKSLVQELLKEPETFEDKIVGSFVRIKSDPNDFRQKNYHQLVEVTGVKNASRTDGTSAEVLLKVSNSIRDIRICMLSDDNFSQEECEDLRQRMKNGLPKQPTVEELEQKTQILHEDITKHWLVRELALLQNLIDRANEKGWRKELFELLDKRQLLQSTSEQSRLLHDVPEVIGDELDVEAVPQDSKDDVQENNGSQISMLHGSSENPIFDVAANVTVSTWTTSKIDSAGTPAALLTSKQDSRVGTGADLITFKPDCGMGTPAALLMSKHDSRVGTGADLTFKQGNQMGTEGDLMTFNQDNRMGIPTAFPKSKQDSTVGTGADLMTFKQDNRIGSPASLPISKQESTVGTGADLMTFKQDNQMETLAAVPTPIQNSRDGTGTYWMSFEQDSRIWTPTTLPTSNQDTRIGTGADWTMFKRNRRIGTPSALPMSTQDTRAGTGAHFMTFKHDSRMACDFSEASHDVLAHRQKPTTETMNVSFRGMLPFKVVENKPPQGMPAKQPVSHQVIELSDDEETEDPKNGINIVNHDPETLIWHYIDPRGIVQGPFSLALLKQWSDANYFSPGFKIWKTGQRPDEAMLLSDILHRTFPW